MALLLSLQAVVNIGAQHNFGLIIEATHGGHWTGDIGVDDIKFVDCVPKKPIVNCDPDSQFSCVDKTQCINNRYVCDGQVCTGMPSGIG